LEIRKRRTGEYRPRRTGKWNKEERRLKTGRQECRRRRTGE
jgi:hypothetical protein